MEETVKETPVVKMNQVVEEKPKTTYETAFTVRQTLLEAKASCTRMPGDMLFAINKNLEIVEKHVKAFFKEREKAADMFYEKDEKGALKLMEQSEEDIKAGKPQEYVCKEGFTSANFTEYLSTVIKDEIEFAKPFKTIPLSSFAKVEVNAEKFKSASLFVDMFVVEK